jgi:hypothetical protein
MFLFVVTVCFTLRIIVENLFYYFFLFVKEKNNLTRTSC